MELLSMPQDIRLKADHISNEIRERIVSGGYVPGERLPTRDALTERYGVSKVTVQRALEALANEGFVVADGRRGTFVAEGCPHLTRYKLLFPFSQMSQPNQFWLAMEREAEALGSEHLVECFFGFEGHRGYLRYESLIADVEANRVAGLIFAANPFHVEGSPLLTRPGIPRVAVMTKSVHPGIPAICHDTRAFIHLCMKELASRGCRRPAVITPRWHDHFESILDEALEEYGMETPDTWVQIATLGEPQSADRLVRLLFEPSRAHRPDSLFVSDDNLVEHATRGLRKLGLRAPEDVTIVAGCNFPWPTPSCLPVTRIGYSTTELLRKCVQVIDCQRRGEAVADRIVLQPIHEREVPKMHAPQWIKSPSMKETSHA